MTNRTIILVLSAVLIAAVVSGCVQEVSEIETTGEMPEPGGTPDVTTPPPVSEVPTSLNASISTDKLVYETGEPVKTTLTPVGKLHASNHIFFTYYRWVDSGWKIISIGPCGPGGIEPDELVLVEQGYLSVSCPDFFIAVEYVDPIIIIWDQRELVRHNNGERSKYGYRQAPDGKYKVGYKPNIHSAETVETEFEIRGGMTAFASVPPELANWNYVSYRNLSISNAPALNQTARITYSIIPGRDLEVLSVGIHIPEGFVFVDADKAAHQVGPTTQMVFRNASLWRPIDLSQKNTCLFDEVTLRRRFKPPDKSDYSAFWYTTNLSKDEMYRFSATIQAVKTGNWTIHTYDEDIYISVSEDSAYIRDTPFPKPPPIGYVLNKSEIEKIRANVSITPSRPSKYNITPRPLNISDVGRPPGD